MTSQRSCKKIWILAWLLIMRARSSFRHCIWPDSRLFRFPVYFWHLKTQIQSNSEISNLLIHLGFILWISYSFSVEFLFLFLERAQDFFIVCCRSGKQNTIYFRSWLGRVRELTWAGWPPRRKYVFASSFLSSRRLPWWTIRSSLAGTGWVELTSSWLEPMPMVALRVLDWKNYVESLFVAEIEVGWMSWAEEVFGVIWKKFSFFEW